MSYPSEPTPTSFTTWKTAFYTTGLLCALIFGYRFIFEPSRADSLRAQVQQTEPISLEAADRAREIWVGEPPLAALQPTGFTLDALLRFYAAKQLHPEITYLDPKTFIVRFRGHNYLTNTPQSLAFQFRRADTTMGTTSLPRLHLQALAVDATPLDTFELVYYLLQIQRNVLSFMMAPAPSQRLQPQ